MKGKTLFLLIQELEKAERHQLLNVCKRSGDKRQMSLYKLVKDFSSSKETFADQLEKISKDLAGKKDEKEKDKVLRRFIDFASKEIENIKLRNLLDQDSVVRNQLLSKIYLPEKSLEIHEKYLEKTLQLAKYFGNREVIGYSLDCLIDLRSQSHLKKEMVLLKNLLLEKNNLIQKNYHHDLAEIFELLSILDFEDQELMEELKPLVLSDEEQEALIELSEGTVEEVEYLLAAARFEFFSDRFDALMKKTKAAIKRLQKGDRQKMEEKSSRLYAFYLMNNGSSAQKIISECSALERSEKEFDVFYWHLYRLCALAEQNLAIPDPKELKLHFSPGNQFRVDFLIMFSHFLKEEYPLALKKLADLPYVPNFQVSTWSRLFELKIHIEKENGTLCESLINRISRHLLGHKGKRFLELSNKQSFKILSDSLKVHSSRKGKDNKEKLIQQLSPLHKLLIR